MDFFIKKKRKKEKKKKKKKRNRNRKRKDKHFFSSSPSEYLALELCRWVSFFFIDWIHPSVADAWADWSSFASSSTCISLNVRLLSVVVVVMAFVSIAGKARTRATTPAIRGSTQSPVSSRLWREAATHPISARIMAPPCPQSSHPSIINR